MVCCCGLDVDARPAGVACIGGAYVTRVEKSGGGGMPTPRLQRYEHLKEIDEALRGALVLADLKMHENRAPPAWLADSSPDGPGLTESRVLEALVVEARRLQAWLPPHPDWPLSLWLYGSSK